MFKFWVHGMEGFSTCIDQKREADKHHTHNYPAQSIREKYAKIGKWTSQNALPTENKQ